jgi:hypothetical protein
MAEKKIGVVANSQFIEDINKNQKVYVFKMTFSTLPGDLDAITMEDVEDQKQQLGIEDAETYLNDDILAVHIYKNDLYKQYSTILFHYSLIESDNYEDQIFAFATSVKTGDYANQDLQDYTQNWIYLNLKGFDLKCKFMLKKLPSNGTFHDHNTTNFDTVDQSIKLCNIRDFKERVLPIIQDASETINPSVNDGTYTTSTGMRILPNGMVVNDGQVIYKPQGRLPLTPNNLNIVKKIAIAQEDKFIDL